MTYIFNKFGLANRKLIVIYLLFTFFGSLFILDFR